MRMVSISPLQNPSYPEWLSSSTCSVLSVDIHPQHPHMIVTARNVRHASQPTQLYYIGPKKTSRNTYFMLYI